MYYGKSKINNWRVYWAARIQARYTTEDELEQVRQEVEALNNGLFLLDGILGDPDIRMRSWLKDDK